LAGHIFHGNHVAISFITLNLPLKKRHFILPSSVTYSINFQFFFLVQTRLHHHWQRGCHELSCVWKNCWEFPRIIDTPVHLQQSIHFPTSDDSKTDQDFHFPAVFWSLQICRVDVEPSWQTGLTTTPSLQIHTSYSTFNSHDSCCVKLWSSSSSNVWPTLHWYSSFKWPCNLLHRTLMLPLHQAQQLLQPLVHLALIFAAAKTAITAPRQPLTHSFTTSKKKAPV